MSALQLEALDVQLAAHGHPARRMALGQRAEILVSERGGRVYGPFIDGEDALGWAPNAADLEAALAERAWNIGGERIWLAPEGLFNYADPARLLETYRVDAAFDPGRWRLHAAGKGVRLALAAEVPLTNGRGSVVVDVSRDIQPLPERTEEGVTIVGYRQHIELRQISGPPLPLVPWLVRQVQPVGTAFLEAVEGARAQAVFGSPPGAALLAKGGWWRVPFQGPGFFKTAHHRAAVGGGRIGFLGPGPSAVAVLYIPVTARIADYPESLPQDAEATGQFASLFYDEGRFGAYGEVELYGHRTPDGMGRLDLDTLLLTGPEAAVSRRIGLA
ncbi:hypothetical protein [Mesorhizobium sp. DCY119]|uniref:hypothetical protein n=1 Tax=Mesorhizobium sp. DCY119 TaxID=2108445 RepID=UPI000E6BFFE9|nr:hypothetical protein [Mesorhizobium sp. DCY119]